MVGNLEIRHLLWSDRQEEKYALYWRINGSSGCVNRYHLVDLKPRDAASLVLGMGEDIQCEKDISQIYQDGHIFPAKLVLSLDMGICSWEEMKLDVWIRPDEKYDSKSYHLGTISADMAENLYYHSKPGKSIFENGEEGWGEYLSFRMRREANQLYRKLKTLEEKSIECEDKSIGLYNIY